MAFLNVYLLGGLALLGVPILVHLMMRQKPRRLPFPAFRFLRQQQKINRRRMRLQHLLLMALRMAVLAALCFALAQPKVFLPRAVAGWFGLNGPRPAAAAFVFDVSYSMEYRVGGLSRLDDARQRALELLHDLPEGSQIAVLDTGDDGGGDEGDDDWSSTPAQARARINGLRPRPVQTTLVRQIGRAADLLAKAAEGGQPASRALYVFSDRTATSWDADEAKRLKVPEGVDTAYVDLGVDAPRDLAIDTVEVTPRIVAAGGELTVHAEVRAVGADFDANLLCQLDNEASPASQRVKLSAASKTPVGFDFKLKAPTPVRPPGTPEGVYEEPHQVAVKFATPDDRPFKDDLMHDNIRYATFLVRDDPKRQGRQVLKLEGPTAALDTWWAALTSYQMSHHDTGFRCERKPLADADKLGLKDLQPYRVVCLIQPAKPLPESFLQALEEYVKGGGGLAIVPPVAELTPAEIAAWNAAAEKHQLLPARLMKLADAPAGIHFYWDDFDAKQPLTAPFARWKRGVNPDFGKEELRPFVNRYWQVEPIKDVGVVLGSYADVLGSPALVERSLGDGRVVMFTTTLERHPVGLNRDWNNFMTDSSFGLVLVNETCKYLAGDESGEALNYLCGTPVVLPLPDSAPRGVYRLDAPDQDLTESERSLTAGKEDHSLEVRAASAPGQYTLYDPGHNRFAAFSMNISPKEADLDRLPVQDIETVLGPHSVLTPEPGASLNDALRDRGRSTAPAELPPAPVSLLPTLMALTLLFLTFEGLLANRFYSERGQGSGVRGQQETGT